MERATDTEPSGEVAMPGVHDLRGLPDATGAGNVAPPAFTSVDAQGLDFAPTYDTNAPLNPLAFTLGAPDFPGAPETDAPAGRETAETGADADAARGYA